MFIKSRRWQAVACMESRDGRNPYIVLTSVMFLLLCFNIQLAGAADCNYISRYSGNYAGDLAGYVDATISSGDVTGVWEMSVSSDLEITVEVYDAPFIGDLTISGSGALDPDTGLADMTVDFLGTYPGTGGVDCDGNFFFDCPGRDFHLYGTVDSNGDASGTWSMEFTYILVNVTGNGTFSGQKLFTAPNLVDWNSNLVADFGDNGLWYHDGSTWNWMTNTGNVGSMVVWNGNLVVDFGAGGLQYYDGSWHWMTNKGDVAMMINWNDGSTERLVVDFGAGQRVYTYDGSWDWFTNKDGVAGMTVWSNKLIVDFGGGRGIYNYDTSWHWMTNKDDVAMMLPWDNGTTENLVVDFGGGRRVYTYDGSWNWFTNKDDVRNMVVWNQKLVVDFGPGLGLYNYDSAWNWMSNKDDVSGMVAWNDGSADKLAVDFGINRNMSYYDGSWNWMRNDNDVPEMLAWNNRLVVDFGSGVGVYNYDGSWNMMRSWSTAD